MRSDIDKNRIYEWEIWSRHLGADVDKFKQYESKNNVTLTGVTLPNIMVTGNNRGTFLRQHKNSFESFIDTTTFAI